MAAYSLLSEKVEAGGELARRFNTRMPVEAAFWLKTGDDDYEYLYLATDEVDKGHLDLGYGEVRRISDQLQSIYLDPFLVKLIGKDDPLTKAAVAKNNRFGNDNLGTRMGSHMFGDTFIEYGYLYPQNLQAAGH